MQISTKTDLALDLTFRQYLERYHIVQSYETGLPSSPVLVDSVRQALDILYPSEPIARETVFFLPKKSGKSSLYAAGLGIWHCLRKPDSAVWIAANSREQSERQILEAVKYACKYSDLLRRITSIQGSRILFENGSRIESLSSKATSIAGLTHGHILIDETWSFQTEDDELRWSELTPAPNMTRTSFSYAGTPRSLILADLVGKLEQGEMLDQSLPVFHNSDLSIAGILDDGLHHSEPDQYFFRLPYVDQTYLDQQRESMLNKAGFNRLWMNRVDSVSGQAMISPEQWAVLADSRVELFK